MGTVPLSAALQHYCRVCNTQLNSCKQARIHVAGKKHEKRLAYLKFSLETSEAVNSSYTTANVGQYMGVAGGGAVNTTGGVAVQPMSSALPTVYAYPPPCGGYAPTPQHSAPAYYYPPAPAQVAPPPQYPSQLGQHAPAPHGIYHYDQPQTSQPPTSVSAAVSLTHYPAPHGPAPHGHPPHVNHSNCSNRRGKTTGKISFIT